MQLVPDYLPKRNPVLVLHPHVDDHPLANMRGEYENGLVLLEQAVDLRLWKHA